MSLVLTFKNLVRTHKIPYRNITALRYTLSQIKAQKDIPLQESFNQIYKFLVLAIEFYEKNTPEDIQVRKATVEEPESNVPIPESYTELTESRIRPVNTALINLMPTSNTEEKPNSTSASPEKKSTKRSTKSIEKISQSSSIFKTEVPVKSTLKERMIAKQFGVYQPNKPKSVNVSPLKRNAMLSKQPGSKKTKASYKNQSFEDNRYEDLYDDILKEEVMFTLDVKQSEAEKLIDEIDIKERENREYRGKVKRIIADHDRFVSTILSRHCAY